MKNYPPDKTREISFPLGGIGTGCIGLSGSGRLVDWEIRNRPNKGSLNGYTHFAIKAERAGQVVDARVIAGDLPFPLSGQYGREKFKGFGFGPERGTMAGFPSFKDSSFSAEFPFAKVSFADSHFPGDLKMGAFNPFIPLKEDDSSLPAAFFEFEIVNSSKESLKYTINCGISNPHEMGTTVQSFQEIDTSRGSRGTLTLTSTLPETSTSYGELCLGVEAPETSFQEYWYRGSWFDDVSVYWTEFSSPGIFKNRHYDQPSAIHQDHASLAGSVSLAPGEKGSLRFLLSWNFPNAYNYWALGQTDQLASWKNHYATIFPSASHTARYGFESWDRLEVETREFSDALASSTLPEVVLEAVSANLAVLKSPTCLRLTDGSFYGWEGCHCAEGSCEGSCTHVWNYAYALPFLFPRLERSMRNLDFRYNQKVDGGMVFRLMLPLGSPQWDFRPCADGQFGGVIKVYRDWKISGNTQWLRELWPAVVRSLEYAWSPSNPDHWDPERKGILTGRQHHTLDMELFGPNSWLTGFYLAALKAASEMARSLGDSERSNDYFQLFERGRLWVQENLFNGKYFCQKVDLHDPAVLDSFAEGSTLIGKSTKEAYWDEESNQIKYQIGQGCEIDQLVGQWHANIAGLGRIFDQASSKTALRSLFDNNFKSMREVANPCRLYSLYDEKGLVIASWPSDVEKPRIPLPYSEETQNGYEYQAAALMIQEGLVNEGIAVVRSIRDRYDGEKRNPWNEFECGSNYARSMASYSLLLAFSGFEFNAVEGLIGFNPLPLEHGSHKYFWSLDSGWGVFEMDERSAQISVHQGVLALRKLKLPFFGGKPKKISDSRGGFLTFKDDADTLVLDMEVQITPNNPVLVVLTA